MPFEPINLGITLSIPTAGTKNWATTLKTATWNKISSHNHTGGGNGVQLTSGSIDLTNFYGTQQTGTISAGSVTVNWNNGTNIVVDASAQVVDVTLALGSANPLSGKYYRMILKSSAANKFAFSGATIKWQGGVDPFNSSEYLLSSGTAGKIDIVDMYFDGSVYYGQWQPDFS